MSVVLIFLAQTAAPVAPSTGLTLPLPPGCIDEDHCILPEEPAIVKKPELLKTGQTLEQVSALMGFPDAVEHRDSAHFADGVKDGNAVWLYRTRPGTSGKNLSVTFATGKVTKIRSGKFAYAPEPNEPKTHEKLERIAGAVLEVTLSVYLSRVCPQVRRKPVILLSADDVQTVQVCTASGF